MTSKKEYELKKKFRELSELKGRGTELISVYIPEDYNINEVTGKLREEYGQASNIKSKSTRKNVQTAIGRIIEYIKLFKKTPKHGLVVFCGNVVREGKESIEFISLQPPEDVNVQTYRCDSSFFLEPLEALLEPKEGYGLFTVDKREATIAVLKGPKVKIIKRLTSGVPGKTRAGGQSAARFERLREVAENDFFKKVGETVNSAFDPDEIKGVIVGGPGFTKHTFLNKNYVSNKVGKKVLGTIDTGYTDQSGINEMVNKCSEILSEQETIREKQLLNRFISEVVKNGLAAYGVEDIKKYLDSGQVKELLVSEDAKVVLFETVCEKCGKKNAVLSKKPDEYRLKEHYCDCGGKQKTVGEKDVVEKLLDLAEQQGVKITIISSETTEAAQFKNGFGGVGAFLRYR